MTADYLDSAPGTSPTVDLNGVINSAGQRVWQYSGNEKGDVLASLSVSPLAGKWYASAFPNAQFVIPVDLADTFEGIYSEDNGAVWLYGFASTQQHPAFGETLLPYAQPVPTYQFPLQVGASWSASAQVVGGLLDGLAWTRTDTYQFSVDAVGIVELPDFTFTQVLRLRTVANVANEIGGTTVTRSMQLLTQCYGEVYLATSQPNEMNDDFSSASEVRRLSLQP